MRKQILAALAVAMLSSAPASAASLLARRQSSARSRSFQGQGSAKDPRSQTPSFGRASKL